MPIPKGDRLESAKRKEILELIRAHHNFRVQYAAALRKFPDPWPTPIADPDDTKGPGDQERARKDHLSLMLPFQAAYWPRSNEIPTTGQKHARVLSATLAQIMQRLRDHLVRSSRETVLTNYPLGNFRLGTQSPMDAPQILSAIDRHLELLLGDLKLSADLDEILRVRIEIDLPAVLREARMRKNHTQAEGASKCGVDADTYKSWELGRNSPSRKNRVSMQAYIFEAFGLLQSNRGETSTN